MTPSSTTLAVVPNKPKTPLHSFRVSDEDWQAARAQARAEGTDLSKLLQAYVRRIAKRGQK